jgi:uncharacterized cupredoxin-like copper-binding protein
MSSRILAAGFVLVLLAACGGDGGGAAADGHSHPRGEGHDHGSDAAAGGASSFGAPGDPAAAAQTIEVTAADPYRFEPEALAVGAGETVTFVVTNDGDQEHEFVLGDRAYQESHGAAMAAGEMHHEGNAVTVAPGATEELTWKFAGDGEVLYGCHVEGHYQAGMVGVVRVGA